MVAPVYIEPVSLEDYFWSVHSRSVTDRQALDWTEHHIASGKLGITPEPPAKPYRLKLTDRRRLVIDTNDADPRLYAADYQVKILAGADVIASEDPEVPIFAGPGLRLILPGYVLAYPFVPQAPATKSAAPKRKGRPSGHRWGIADPKVEALVEQYGPYDTIAAAVQAVNTELEDAGEEPFDPRWAGRRIRRKKPLWLIPELRPAPRVKRAA